MGDCPSLRTRWSRVAHVACSLWGSEVGKRCGNSFPICQGCLRTEPPLAAAPPGKNLPGPLVISYSWTVENVVLNGTDVTSMWRDQMGLSGGGDTAGMLTAGLPAGFWGLTVKCAVSWTNSSESDCAECQGPRAATVTVAFVTVGVKRIEWKDGDTWKEAQPWCRSRKVFSCE